MKIIIEKTETGIEMAVEVGAKIHTYRSGGGIDDTGNLVTRMLKASAEDANFAPDDVRVGDLYGTGD